ncbi:multidrug transporter subunit MdtD [Niveibacterium sp. SC-1]|uniref:multidrug transporter subunit MdtD n=1 Tax=Niveibacterium sp. SC-1 TaxID=3135646 RepID=UPI00311F711C
MAASSHRGLLYLVAVGLFMQTLDGTIVNTALPSMARDLGESPFRMEMVVIAYMLTVALLMPASGWLADRFGTRRIYLLAIALFTLGSFLCAESRSLGQLIASRVVQGVGGALLVPVGRLAVLRTFPRDELLNALSIATMPALLGPLLGPLLGGWLSEKVSWHWIFLINLPVGVLGLVLARRFMPDFRDATPTPFDLAGFLLFSISVTLVSLALEGMGELHISHAFSLLLLVGGAGGLVAYWLHAVRKEQPLFNPELFRINSYAVGILGNLFARLGAGGMPFLMPLMLQLGLQLSPVEAGWMMMPVALAALCSKVLVSRIVDRFGYRRVLVSNTLLVGLLLMSFATVDARTPRSLLMLQLFCFGACNGLQFTVMNTLTLKDLPESQASGGNSLLSVTMQLSMSMGVGIAATLLSGFLRATNAVGVGGLTVFHPTFVCIGLLGVIASAVFLQLDPRTSGRPDARIVPSE